MSVAHETVPLLEVLKDVLAAATPRLSFLDVAEGRNRSSFYSVVGRLTFNQGTREDFAALVQPMDQVRTNSLSPPLKRVR